ncbi:glycosyltransferase family 4 protein [Acidisoma cellulosilytica]|uniref:Glycosyltransferase family 4 protein n=1 Tax=Acidisoma cellulosilyticum TaxID=2802395 RepID=A0A963Z3K3_9PROT|nr:glycosyltransferase family 4 protein [Acidisoma cellulosilyticum]MCB8882205.1 glycosyltransferase family 4 protein [Acidisoma cellulosilyticum]
MRVAIHDYAGHPFQFDLSRALARLGHDVRHFYFADDPGPKGDRRVRAEDPAGFSVEPIRIPLAYSKDSMLRRFICDQLYAHAAARSIAAFKPDVVLSGNAPLDVQRILRATAHRRRAKFIFWVQDFYGLAMQKLLARRWFGAGRVIAYCYRASEIKIMTGSDAIILISPGFLRYLPPGLKTSNRVHVVRNWGSVALITPGARDNAWRRKMGLSGQFVFMYTGTLALKHDPQLLLALCDAYAQNEAVQIVVVAAGINAQRLAELQRQSPRRNLTLLPLQPAEELPEVLATADVLLAILEEDAGEFAVPSKLLNYLCAGRPILLSAPGDNLATVIMEESGAGLTVTPQDASGFLESAQALHRDDASRQRFGQSGRAYAERHFAIEAIALRFDGIIRQTLSPAPFSAASTAQSESPSPGPGEDRVKDLVQP